MNRGRQVAIAGLLLAMVFAIGCTDKQITACAKAAAGVAAGLDVVQQENELLCGPAPRCAGGKINQEEATAIANAVNSGTVANDAFVNCVRGIEGSNQKAQTVICFQGLTASLSKVQASVLYIKNPDAQQALALSFQSVQTALIAVRALTQ
jgi:hypothetical protein